MFYFKSCTKCHGDLTLEKDAYGSYLKCLQCGKFTDVNEVQTRQSVSSGSWPDKAGVRAVSRSKAKTAVAA